MQTNELDLDSRHITNDRMLDWYGIRPAPPARLDAITDAYRGSGLTLERMLLDLHTGRLLGPAGEAMINIASILLLVLIFSGIALWLGRARGNGSNGPSD